jgi:hypothetical protein
MPNETQIPEATPIPEWVHWTRDEAWEWFDDNATRCECCDDYRLVRYPRHSEMPDFITTNDELSGHTWVSTFIHDRHTGNPTMPMIREDFISYNTDSFTSEWHRDVSYSAIDEYYDYICEGCSDNRGDANYQAENESEDSSDHVHDYGYRPRTKFFTHVGDTIVPSSYAALSAAGQAGVLSPASYDGVNRVQVPYLGFELEMTRNDSSWTVDDTAKFIDDHVNEYAYLKWDGSVDRGFELVTHPHTLEAYNARESLWFVLDKMRERGWRSWNSTSSCGLHIHINNASFSSLGHGMRFLLFIYRNREPLVRFAGRDSHYARFDYNQFVQRTVHVGWNDDGSPRYEVGTVADVVKKKQANDNRYLAVNAQNTHTYELRFFRGNMNPNAVRACLEFVYALHEYTETLTSHDCLVNRALTWRPFLAFVRRKSTEPDFRYRRLYDRLTLARRNGDNGFINTAGAE